MKQMKFLMVAFTLLMGISLTSCLNSNDNSDDTQAHFVRVKRDMSTGYQDYFEDYLGNKLFPTSGSLVQVEANGNFKMSSSNFAYISYKMAEVDGTTKTEAGTTAKSYNINLLSAANCDGPAPITVDNTEDMESAAVENAPIFTLNYNNVFSPFLYDKETLFLPVYYKMENKAEQVSQHKLILVCNLDGITAESTDIVFYLCHDRGTDEKSEAINVALNGYNIRQALARFTAATGGKEPTKVIVNVKETGAYASSNELPEKYTVYSGDFKVGSVMTKNN